MWLGLFVFRHVSEVPFIFFSLFFCCYLIISFLICLQIDFFPSAISVMPLSLCYELLNLKLFHFYFFFTYSFHLSIVFPCLFIGLFYNCCFEIFGKSNIRVCLYFLLSDLCPLFMNFISFYLASVVIWG